MIEKHNPDCQFSIFGKRSLTRVITTEAIATRLPIPNRNSMKKKQAENNCGRNFIFAKASGKEMKALNEIESN
jgi:hypothetical protein